MPRVHKQVARNDIYERGTYTPDPKLKKGKKHDRSKPADDKDMIIVKKGQTYYWWQFRYGGKQISTTYPKPQQLTQSAYYQACYDIADMISNVSASDPSDLESARDEIRDAIEDLKSETEEKLDNMPESLKYSPTGELLQERIDSLDSAYSEIDGIDLDYDEPYESELRTEAIESLQLDEDDEESLQDQEDEINKEIERIKEEKLQEWLDEKIEEIKSVAIE